MNQENLRVLQFSTHQEDCGIAKYQEQFVRGMSTVSGLETEFFEYSPNQTKIMSPAEFTKALATLKSKLEDFEILHIQHELSFFYGNELSQIVDVAKNMGKKIIVTVHTAPDAQLVTPHLGGLGLRSILHFVRQKLSATRFLNKYVNPLKKVDLIIVHNQSTKQNLVKYGVDDQKVQVIRHPVPVFMASKKSEQIREQLKYKKGDIIFAAVGFISASKGTIDAIKALTLLPDNYKLAIIGGVHPDSQDTSFLNMVADQIYSLGLKDRVYITGFVKEDDELNALVREADICVYPFDKRYYSYVSSGSLNIAISNYKPVVAYHTPSFDETNTELDVVEFCKSPNYYELARSIQDINIQQRIKTVEEYAALYNWDKEAVKFVEFYRSVLAPSA